MHAAVANLVEEYLPLAGHGADVAGRFFVPVTNNRTGELPASRCTATSS
jgi:hypothetical protein